MLIAGTFGGVTMLKAGKIRKAVNELTSYMTAINQFQTQYNFLPGDLPTASTYWATNPVTGSATHNGNGDGIVAVGGSINYGSGSNTNEYLYTWEHLADAKLIPGTYDGVGMLPNSEPYTQGLFFFFTSPNSIYNTRGNAIYFTASGLLGFLLAKDAYAIDVKIDDGLAASGMLYGSTDSSGCVSDIWYASTATYVLSDTNAKCSLTYWQKKF